jgi:hypothetical protein
MSLARDELPVLHLEGMMHQPSERQRQRQINSRQQSASSRQSLSRMPQRFTLSQQSEDNLRDVLGLLRHFSESMQRRLCLLRRRSNPLHLFSRYMHR